MDKNVALSAREGALAWYILYSAKPLLRSLNPFSHLIEMPSARHEEAGIGSPEQRHLAHPSPQHPECEKERTRWGFLIFHGKFEPNAPAFGEFFPSLAGV